MKRLTLALALLLAAPALAEGPAHETLPAGQVDDSGSLYQLQAKLEGGDGKTVGLDVFRGQPVLVSLFYGRCPAACPLLIAQIKRIEKGLTAEARAGMRVLLVSMDPKSDTPEVLAALTEAHRLDGRWRLTRTDDAKVQEIAAVLGVRYRKLKSGEINHSTVVTVLDAAGNPVGRVDGLNKPLEDITAHAEALGRAAPRAAR
jgi:protein SCO1